MRHERSRRYIKKSRIAVSSGGSGIPPMLPGETIEEGIVSAVTSRLHQTEALEGLGFKGFRNRVVADVGTRDGRFVPMLERLGAREVYGIDPSTSELNGAVQAGVLDADHAVPTRIEDLPEQLKGRLEGAGIFNFCVPRRDRPAFFRGLHDALTPGSQVVMTVAEENVLRDTLPDAEQYFDVDSRRLWPGSGNAPHAYVVVGTRKDGKNLQG